MYEFNPFKNYYSVFVKNPRDTSEDEIKNVILKDKMTSKEKLDFLTKRAQDKEDEKNRKEKITVEIFVEEFIKTIYELFTKGFFIFMNDDPDSIDQKFVYLGIMFLVLAFILLLSHQ
jgi:uncharacterized ion transporter superfamily protein YfcC